MDEELRDLADRLCVVAGIIMEEHHPLVISVVDGPDERSARLMRLGLAADDIAKLIAAAKVLVSATA